MFGSVVMKVYLEVITHNGAQYDVHDMIWAGFSFFIHLQRVSKDIFVSRLFLQSTACISLQETTKSHLRNINNFVCAEQHT